MRRRRANQTKVQTSTGIWEVAYNAENRPVSFTNGKSNTVVECSYDSMGRLVTKKVTHNGTETLHQRYLYRGYLQIAACDLKRAGEPCLWLITWDPTEKTATRPLAIRKDVTWYCYGWDLTKNICEVFKSDGYIGTAYTYAHYGAVSSTGTVTQPIQWSSEFCDEEMDLICYNCRYYIKLNGVWNIPDPFLARNVNNAYSFVQNSPVSAYNILGLITIQQWVRETYASSGLNEKTLIAILIAASRGCIGIVGTKLGVDARGIDLTKCYKDKTLAERELKKLDCSDCTNLFGEKSKPRMFSVHTYEGIVYSEKYPNGFKRKFESTNGVFDISMVRDNPTARGEGYGNYDFAILEDNQMIGATHADLRLYNAVVKRFKVNLPLFPQEDVNWSIEQKPQVYIRDVDTWQSEVDEASGYNTEFWCIMCEKNTIRN